MSIESASLKHFIFGVEGYMDYITHKDTYIDSTNTRLVITRGGFQALESP